MSKLPVDDGELEQWAHMRADDAGRLARELVDARALIRDMVHQLRWLNEYSPSAEVLDLLDRAAVLGLDP